MRGLFARLRGRRADREGMILLNVLLVVAVASVAVLVMVVAQDIEVQRGGRLRDAAQAGAYARSGELSAITVLRRDALVAAASDNLTEPWAAIGQQSISVPGGRFALAIEDEQSRFNINVLQSGEAGPIATFQALGEALAIDPGTMIRIASVVRIAGPLSDTGLLRTAGVTPGDLAQLEAYVVALPSAATVNLNTVGQPLLAILVGDADIAADLIRQREQRGFLIPDDLAAIGLPSLAGTGYTSDHYRVATTVTVGDTTQRLTSRIARVRGEGRVDVVVTGRQRTAG